MALNSLYNFGAYIAGRKLKVSASGLKLAQAKLSAGQRVTSARDGAVALAIGSRLGAEAAALGQAYTNTGQGAAMLRVADGRLARTGDMLNRMRQLAVQAGSGQLSASERNAIGTEFRALAAEVDRVSVDTDFGGARLLDGSVGTVDIRTGTGTGAEDEVALSFDDSSTSALGLAGVGISTATGANAALGAIDNAIDAIQTARAGTGAAQNRLDFAAANIATAAENTEAARSSLLDLDIGRGTSELAGLRTRFEAGLSTLKDADDNRKHILKLMV